MTVLNKKTNPFELIKKKKTKLTIVKTKEPEFSAEPDETQPGTTEETLHEKDDSLETELKEKESFEEVQPEEVQSEEEQAEEKPSKTRRRTKRTNSKNSEKKKAVEEKLEEEKANDDKFVALPKTEVTYLEAISRLTPDLRTEEWEKLEREIQEELDEIVVEEDMNPGSLKVALNHLDDLKSKIRHHLFQAREAYIRLSSEKPEGIIERIKRINLGTGNNDMERRKAGIIACMCYNPDKEKDGTINLYDILDETRYRYFFLDSVDKSIRHKSDLLITMSSSLKLEHQHVMQGDDA